MKLCAKAAIVFLCGLLLSACDDAANEQTKRQMKEHAVPQAAPVARPTMQQAVPQAAPQAVYVQGHCTFDGSLETCYALYRIADPNHPEPEEPEDKLRERIRVQTLNVDFDQYLELTCEAFPEGGITVFGVMPVSSCPWPLPDRFNAGIYSTEGRGCKPSYPILGCIPFEGKNYIVSTWPPRS